MTTAAKKTTKAASPFPPKKTPAKKAAKAAKAGTGDKLEATWPDDTPGMDNPAMAAAAGAARGAGAGRKKTTGRKAPVKKAAR